MMKLCLLVALLGLGCNNKKPEERKDDTPVERIDEARPAPSPTQNAQPKPTAPTAPAGSAGVPVECTDLRDAIAKMNQCAKFDNSAKAQLSKQAETLMASGSAAGTDPAALATQCKGTADSIQKAGAAACGW
ncbi:MAG: hypothetical protein WKG01_29600 [Kofleriaceae bacterium]